MAFAVRRSTLLVPVALAVALAGGMLAPSAARAECGDYVVYTNGPHANPMSDDAPKPVPCQGPGCSQIPAPAPMPQPPTQVRILADEALIAAIGFTSAVPDSLPSPRSFPVGEPIRRGSDIYHPPR
ncbi:MAG TPA: hypothetical protein VKE40_00215 [Gemmataceae bacterium]|nr:hypothetical protein [Gemmataceae bacterium]